MYTKTLTVALFAYLTISFCPLHLFCGSNDGDALRALKQTKKKSGLLYYIVDNKKRAAYSQQRKMKIIVKICGKKQESKRSKDNRKAYLSH